MARVAGPTTRYLRSNRSERRPMMGLLGEGGTVSARLRSARGEGARAMAGTDLTTVCIKRGAEMTHAAISARPRSLQTKRAQSQRSSGAESASSFASQLRRARAARRSAESAHLMMKPRTDAL